MGRSIDQVDELPSPELLTQNNFELLLRRVADDIGFGSDESIFVGSGMEYVHSRPYEPGDSVRQIDWKVTARMPVAYVKVHETLKRIPMFLVVDTSASMQASSIRLSKHAVAVWVAGALGLVALRRLSPVCVLSGGSRYHDFIGDANPSLVPDDLWRQLDPLRWRRMGETTELSERIDALAVKLRQRSVLVVISDLYDSCLRSAIGKVGPKHDVIVIHLEDPAERGQLRAGYFMGAESEGSHRFLGADRDRWSERDHLEREFAGADVSYLRLATDQPVVSRLRHFLLTRSVQMRGRQ